MSRNQASRIAHTTDGGVDGVSAQITPIDEIQDLVESLWPYSRITKAQVGFWWNKLERFTLAIILESIKESFNRDLERDKPRNAPVFKEIQQVAARRWDEHQSFGKPVSREEPAIVGYIRGWFDSWEKPPAWVYDFTRRDASQSEIPRDIWESWAQIWQEIEILHRRIIPWMDFKIELATRSGAGSPYLSHSERMEDDPTLPPAQHQELLTRPAFSPMEESAILLYIPRLWGKLIKLQCCGYGTQTARDHWLEDVKRVADQYQITLEGRDDADESPF